MIYCQGRAKYLTGVDNDTHRIDRIQLGMIPTVQTGAGGTCYFDAFESRRSTYIGFQAGMRSFELGKTMRKAGQAKMMVAGPEKTGLRLVGPGELTDYLFTGQHFEEALGLYWVGSRWFDPALGRWIQADSIVPEPYNPQAYDRYQYVFSNPVRYIDPDGYRPCDGKNLDGACSTVTDKDLKELITMNYGWKMKGEWSRGNLYKLLDIGRETEVAYHKLKGGWNKGWAKGWIREYTGNAILHIGKVADTINSILGAVGSVPWKSDVFLPDPFSSYTLIHELAHVMENNLAGTSLLPATYVGGGPADAMVSAMGGHPEQCLPRFKCLGTSLVPMKRADYRRTIAGMDPWPETSYGSNSVADDFAHTLAYTILSPNIVPAARRQWMEAFITLLP